MGFMKQIVADFLSRAKSMLSGNRAEASFDALPNVMIAETVIKGTTYIVSSFFKKDAKGDVVDKIRRLIEREAENTTERV